MPTELPLTAKARGTRERLLTTARSVFESEGYDATSVSRIVEGAGVGRGTFYLYFESKQHIFRTLAHEIQAGLVRLQDWPRTDGLRPEEGLGRAIRTFVAFYRENARFMAVLEQVATHDEGFRSLRLDMRRDVAQRAVKFVRDQQRRGAADASLDARYAATALTGMVDRFAYVWLILGEDFDEDQVVWNLTRLWYQAVGGRLDEPDGDRGLG